ncbi:MAG: hypothetical protein U0795_03710 [Pirellulales bacterium]
MTIAPSLSEVRRIITRTLMAHHSSTVDLFPVDQRTRLRNGQLVRHVIEYPKWLAVWLPQQGVLKIFDRHSRQLIDRKNLLLRLEPLAAAA